MFFCEKPVLNLNIAKCVKFPEIGARKLKHTIGQIFFKFTHPFELSSESTRPLNNLPRTRGRGLVGGREPKHQRWQINKFL